MKSRRTYKSKYLILALILIAMFILPSCRTRLTNNSDVSNIQYDEDGYMTETYQMRRDELGLSTAESPILPDLGSSDEDEEVDDFSEGESIDYNPEDYEEDFTEPEPQTNTTTTTPTTRTPTTTTPRRTTPSTPSPTVTRYTITFDANGGKFNGGGEKYIANVPKGSKLGTHFPPTPTREGYALEGWYTSKDGGSKVKSKDTVNASTTLYAHWEKSKSDTPSKKTYTVTFVDGQGKELKKQKVKEGKSATAPENPTREGYTFVGWDKDFSKVTSDLTVTAKWNEEKKKYKVTLIGDGEDKIYEENEGAEYALPSITPQVGYTSTWNTNQDGTGTSYNPGDKVSAETTLYVHRQKKEAKDYWQDIFDEAKRVTKDDVVACYVVGSEKEKKFVRDCKAESVDKEEVPQFVIVFVEDIANPPADLGELPEGVPVYLIGKKAVDSDNSLVNKIALMEMLHPGSIAGEGDYVTELGGEVLVQEYLQ